MKLLSPEDLEVHPQYEVVLKMVLWGEDREKVFRRMEANKVPGEHANQLYARAVADRVRTIRSDHFRKVMLGCGLIAASVAVFSVCWFGLSFIPTLLLYGCFAVFGVGLWKFVDGVAGWLMAPSKQGSITE